MESDELLAYLEDVFGNYLFAYPIDDMDLAEKSLVRAALSRVQSRVKSRQEALRDLIIDEVKSGQVQTNLVNISLTSSKDNAPNAELFRSLLIEKGIPIESGMDVTVKTTPSPSKIDFLVKTGKLTSAEVDAIRVEKKTLRVKPLGALKDLIEET
jgi:hypothetical protein